MDIIKTGFKCKICKQEIVLHKWGGKVYFPEEQRSIFAWVSANPYCIGCGVMYDPSYISEQKR